MKVTIHNYETYAIDYLDGTLSPELQEAFTAFIVQNPDVAQEIEGVAVALVPNETIQHPNIDSLYRRDRKIIPIFWSLNTVTIGIAASILIITAAFGWMYTQNNSTQVDVANQEIQVNPIENDIDGMSQESGEVVQSISKTALASNEFSGRQKITNIASGADDNKNQTRENTAKNTNTTSGSQSNIAKLTKTDNLVVEDRSIVDENLPLHYVGENEQNIEPTTLGIGIIRAQAASMGIASLESKHPEIIIPEADFLNASSVPLVAVEIQLPPEEKEGLNLSLNFKKTHNLRFNGTPTSLEKVDKKSLKEAFFPGSWNAK
jgi:hypothetical protein